MDYCVLNLTTPGNSCNFIVMDFTDASQVTRCVEDLNFPHRYTCRITDLIPGASYLFGIISETDGTHLNFTCQTGKSYNIPNHTVTSWYKTYTCKVLYITVWKYRSERTAVPWTVYCQVENYEVVQQFFSMLSLNIVNHTMNYIYTIKHRNISLPFHRSTFCFLWTDELFYV